MREFLDVTQLVFSCWILTAPDGPVDDMPVQAESLGPALAAAMGDYLFPDWARERLCFAQGMEGICRQIQSLEYMAIEMAMARYTDASFAGMNILVGKPISLRSLTRLGISESDACRWGNMMRTEMRNCRLAQRQQA